MITHNELTNNLDYNPDTGIFTWILPGQGRIVASRAGTLMKNGYRRIRVNKEYFLEHRLAWFYCFEEWPEFEIDHVNRIRSDNRLDNLKDVLTRLNMHNLSTTSKYGHNIYLRNNKYRVVITINHLTKYFGTYKLLDTAIKVRDFIHICISNNMGIPSSAELKDKYEPEANQFPRLPS